MVAGLTLDYGPELEIELVGIIAFALALHLCLFLCECVCILCLKKVNVYIVYTILCVGSEASNVTKPVELCYPCE